MSAGAVIFAIVLVIGVGIGAFLLIPRIIGVPDSIKAEHPQRLPDTVATRNRIQSDKEIIATIKRANHKCAPFCYSHH